MWAPVYLFALASSVTKIKNNNNNYMILLQCALFYTHAIALIFVQTWDVGFFSFLFFFF